MQWKLIHRTGNHTDELRATMRRSERVSCTAVKTGMHQQKDQSLPEMTCAHGAERDLDQNHNAVPIQSQ